MAEPGWYEDTEDQTSERYWDGRQWTDGRRARAAAPPSPPGDGVSSRPAVAGRIVVALIAGLLLVIGVRLIAAGDDRPTAADRAANAAVRDALSANVLYEVEGSARSVSITIETPTGTSQQGELDVPLTVARGARRGERGLLIGPFAPGDFVYISAQNEGETGSVTCRISDESGRVISENRSSGAYAIATCSGSV